jgi:hypothetical protein
MGAGQVIVLSPVEPVKQTGWTIENSLIHLPACLPPGAYRPRSFFTSTDKLSSLEQTCKVFADKRLPPL